MGYQTSPFGNGVLIGSGGNVKTNVNNYFGPRAVLAGADGQYNTEGIAREYSVEFTGQDFIDGKTQLFPFTIPAGSLIRTVVAKVKTAFVLGGTTPTLALGTSGSETTNGVALSQAQAQAVGSYNLTLNGTWSTTPFAADTIINVVEGGTTPTITSAGRVEYVITYVLIP